MKCDDLKTLKWGLCIFTSREWEFCDLQIRIIVYCSDDLEKICQGFVVDLQVECGIKDEFYID